MPLVDGGHTNHARGSNDLVDSRADTWTMQAREIDTSIIAALLRAASADRRALDELIRMCRPFVENNARKYAWGNTDPEDIVQEVWIQLIEHVHRIREPQALVGWLQVVTRRAAGRLGHRDDRLIPTDLDDDVACTSSTEDQVIADQEQQQITSAIREALDRLNDADRGLLVMLHSDTGPQHYCDISRRVRRPVGSLGPTRRRLLDRLGKDPSVRHVRALCAAG